MSTLGKIYEINLETRMKNVYPVVYNNDYLYVCKVNGSKDVRIFYNTSNPYSRISFVMYDYFTRNFPYYIRSLKLNNVKGNINVYVPHGMSVCFEDYMQYTAEELELKKILQTLETENRKLKNLTNKMNELSDDISKTKDSIAVLEKQKARLEAKVEKKED